MLRISPYLAGFEFQYEVCEKTFLGICTRRKWVKDTYDLSDVTVRQKLIDKGFVAEVARERVGP